MAIIDNTLAAQVPQFDAATPLAQAANIKKLQIDQQQEQFKLMQAEVGAAARGLLPFVNTPEFPQRWTEVTDGLAQRGVLPPQMHEQLRNKPSVLMLKSIIQSTEDPALSFRKQEAGREQANTDRGFGLKEREIVRDQENTVADRALKERALGIQEKVAGRKELPSGFEYAPNGSLRPQKGGPADPDYLRTKSDRQNAPSGYVWNDPADPTKGMKAIPGGPGEKVDAEVAGRLGLAKHFLKQLPEIMEDVNAGKATGGFDAAKAWAGIGKPGQIRRRIDSGAEALLRMLTGAGMNNAEAADYVRRYRLSPTDSAETVIDKLTQLEGELNSVGETVGKGRGGWENVRTTGPTGPTRELTVDKDGWASVDGVKIRVKK